LISIGVDAHKTMNAACALDDAGKELECWEGPNTEAGWQGLLKWAVNLGPDRHWGIEGAWGYGRGLAQYLVAADEDRLRDQCSLDSASSSQRSQARQDGSAGRARYRSLRLPGGRRTTEGSTRGRDDGPGAAHRSTRDRPGRGDPDFGIRFTPSCSSSIPSTRSNSRQ
jgi:hypothetical protein